MYKHHRHHRGYSYNYEYEKERLRRQQIEMEMLREIAIQEAMKQRMMEGAEYTYPAYRTGIQEYRWSNHSHENERRRRKQVEMMRQIALEQAINDGMTKGAEYVYPANKTRVQVGKTMRAACERIFSKVNHQLGKLIVQIKQTDLSADMMNMQYNGRINGINRTFDSQLASYSLENEKRNMEAGFTNRKDEKSKKRLAKLQIQAAGTNNVLKFASMKKFEDIDLMAGLESEKKVTNNPILNYLKKNNW